MSKIWVILGAGHLIRDLQDAINSRHDILRCIVTNQPLNDAIVAKIQVPIINLADYHPRSQDLHLFGFLNPDKERFLKSCHKRFAGLDFQFGNLIHDRAYLADVKLGFGNYLGPMSVVAPGTVLGNHNYLNRCASIGHDVVIGDFNHFGPSSVICGNTQIGNKNYFGANSTLIDGKRIEDGITIGAGGLVREHLQKSGTYVGVPAKMLNREK